MAPSPPPGNHVLCVGAVLMACASAWFGLQAADFAAGEAIPGQPAVALNMTRWPVPVLDGRELASYDGSDGRPIYLAICGYIMDVTQGQQFYGPGADYHMFAGQACTRALVISSLDAKDVSDEVGDFGSSQVRARHCSTVRPRTGPPLCSAPWAIH
jgi:membrane-associated progesterone receptor component